jgi:hypothetical protein
LSLPFIQPAQAQKHVTHNEAVNTLDALVQTSVLSASLSSPPAAVSPGDMYIVATNATGAWAGSAKRLARYGLDGWQFFVPLTGWRTWVVDVGQMQVFDRGQ